LRSTRLYERPVLCVSVILWQIPTKAQPTCLPVRCELTRRSRATIPPVWPASHHVCTHENWTARCFARFRNAQITARL
jgi:hypothetical protein